MLIGLAGLARSGKSTAAEALCDELGFVELSFADPIRKAVKSIFSLTDEQVYGAEKETVIPWLGKSPRQLMQSLGTEWGRHCVADDVWMRLVDRDISRHGDVVVSDLRFENEAAFIRERGGVVIHIQRPICEQVNAHESELGVKVLADDVELVNDRDRDAFVELVCDVVQVL